jgi:signal transduction histidine kinase
MSVDDTLRNSAIAQLSSPNPHDRYLAAKSLVSIGNTDNLSELMRARKGETDATTQRWLDYAIKSSSTRFADPNLDSGPTEPEVDPAAVQRIKSQAIEWVSGVLLHEIGSKIGLLGAAARDEIPNYPDSSTAHQLSNLEKIFEGIVELRKTAHAPHVQEFDLAELVESIVSTETLGFNIDVSMVGRKPLMLLSDPNLLRLALCNGIRNAVESVKSLDKENDFAIVVNWEVTEKDFWISVIDHGLGLIGSAESAFKIGRTSKSGHAGFGLAIARHAMEKLNGSVVLKSSAAGGATYEIKAGIII